MENLEASGKTFLPANRRYVEEKGPFLLSPFLSISRKFSHKVVTFRAAHTMMGRSKEL